VVMIATAVYCAARIAAARWWRRPTGSDVDAVHVLMGTAMAGMLVPGLRFGPAAGWEVVFGAAAGWFGWQAAASRRSRSPAGHRPAQHVQHLLVCLAMLYMLLAVGSGPGATTHLPTLALLLALALIGSVIHTADRLTVLPLVAGGAAARPARPAPAVMAATVTAPPGPARPGPPAGGGAGATGPAVAPARTPALSPRLAACCDIAMGVTMGYLLVLMISS